MDGVLVVDKPQGITSHDVVAIARRCLRETRIGHTGTLDPLATGVLPLVCGRATRLVRFLTTSDKDYDATIRFGITTDSYDITGVELTRSHMVPSRESVEAGLRTLRGEYLQVPPAHSAKKVAGQRAYALARRAEPVTLEPVAVKVSRADLVAFTGATARVAITCSAGFYVRAFAHTLGERVGTGGCLESLRRTRSGEFGLESAIDVQALRQDPVAAAARVVPLDRLLTAFPAARLTDEGQERVSHGQDIEAAHMRQEDVSGLDIGPPEWVRLLDSSGRLLALGTPGRNHTPGAHSLHPAVVLI